MKKFGLILGVLGLGIAVLAALNWGKIERLQRVNTLFDEDKIVHNFSNMREALYSHDLPASGPAHDWPIALSDLPEQVGIGGSSRVLSEFLTETQATALVVIKDGQIVAEDYFQGTGAEDQRISWSMAKSFLSALFGIAVTDGRIESLDDPVTKYVPALAGSAYDGVPIRHVLNMASGVKFNEDYLDPKSDINKMGRVLALGGSMDAFAAGLNVQERPSGTQRQYVSIDTHVLAMVLRSATGQSLHDLFIDNLWSKIGPGKDAYYMTDGQDVAFALGGLNMRTRDFALFGQLILQDGNWNGAQIIPKAWIEASTVDSAPSDAATGQSGFGYGYQWWVPMDSKGEFFAVGIYGQYIYIDPNANMVIAKNSAHRGFEGVGQSGQSYMLENIEMFRALTAHYAP